MRAVLVLILAMALGTYAIVTQDEMLYLCASLGVVISGMIWLTNKLKEYEL
jgi:hypothetical protein